MGGSEDLRLRMGRLEFGQWVLLYDAEATRRAYSAVTSGAPEECGSADCRNFAAARGSIYTAEVLDILDRLGVDHRKEAEIYYDGPIGGGRHAYGDWFHFVGFIEDGEDACAPGGMLRLEHCDDSFQIGFSRSLALVPDAFPGGPLVQLEFQARVPWVLDLPEPR
ncbi:MAG: hypothetical protein M3P51_02550 [Chloroflexota bacterium]|nr:hypothetical protein [Chloroflexota bacterium]